MKRLTQLLVVLALGMGHTACGGNSTTAPNPTSTGSFSLSGIVTDSSTTLGLSGATVLIADGSHAGTSTTTDNGGNYAFTALSSSSFTLNASKNGYASQNKSVSLTSNQLVSFSLATINPIFTMSGLGNTVFSLPSYVTTLHIVGTYSGTSSNFVVWIGPPNVACGTVMDNSCHLIVNDLLGTFFGHTVSDGTYPTGGGTGVTVGDSTGVSWSFTEVR